MIELIKYDNPEKWNNIVNSYINKDVYYLCEYSISLMESEGGTPYLINYKGEDCSLCYPIIEKDIADFEKFKGILKKNTYFDWSTPYGYGGPLSNKLFTLSQQRAFKKELFYLAKSRNVVSQFIRFHPLLKNHLICNNVIENTYVKDTIFINMDTKDNLFIQMDSKNRNMIRKAIKNNVIIKHDKGKYINDFINIYNETMKRDNASPFYYFPKAYYQYIKNSMSNEVEYFYAFKNNVMIAASIFFYSDKFMHYHLSANLLEYRKYAPTNLLIYTAANWGREKGLKQLHLGGGLNLDDSLFHFKKQFNKEGKINFYIGGNIFDIDIYEKLLKLRYKYDNNFNVNNNNYIKYRKI